MTCGSLATHKTCSINMTWASYPHESLLSKGGTETPFNRAVLFPNIILRKSLVEKQTSCINCHDCLIPTMPSSSKVKLPGTHVKVAEISSLRDIHTGLLAGRSSGKERVRRGRHVLRGKGLITTPFSIELSICKSSVYDAIVLVRLSWNLLQEVALKRKELSP